MQTPRASSLILTILLYFGPSTLQPSNNLKGAISFHNPKSFALSSINFFKSFSIMVIKMQKLEYNKKVFQTFLLMKVTEQNLVIYLLQPSSVRLSTPLVRCYESIRLKISLDVHPKCVNYYPLSKTSCRTKLFIVFCCLVVQSTLVNFVY